MYTVFMKIVVPHPVSALQRVISGEISFGARKKCPSYKCPLYKCPLYRDCSMRVLL